MTTIADLGRPMWHKLTRRVFNCPSCGQKLRVPVRPGKTLQVQCSRCPSQFLLDFRIPLIEVFKWQSGKSLKQNLIDFHHRFWNLPLSAKVQVIMMIFVVAMILDMILSPVFSMMVQAISDYSSSASSATPQYLR